MCLVLGNDDFGANFCRQEWHKRILGYVVSRFSYWRGRAFVLFGVKAKVENRRASLKTSVF